MEVPDGRFGTRKVIYVVDAFGGSWCAIRHEVESVNVVFGGGYLVACIAGLKSVLAVEDYIVCIFILDIFN